MALLQREVPQEMAGMSVAILLFFNTVTSNIGPLYIGWVDNGTAELRKPMFLQVLLSNVGAAMLFARAGTLVQNKAILNGEIRGGSEHIRAYSRIQGAGSEPGTSHEGSHGSLCGIVQRVFQRGCKRREDKRPWHREGDEGELERETLLRGASPGVGQEGWRKRVSAVASDGGEVRMWGGGGHQEFGEGVGNGGWRVGESGASYQRVGEEVSPTVAKELPQRQTVFSL
ncbi:unnamed protein product [Choristocarpus tenellus]